MKFRYETLEIWQLAMKLWELWQQIRTKYPKQEQYKLVDQLDRAIEGIGSVLDTLIEKIFFKAIGFQKWLSKNDSRVSGESRLAG